MAEQLMTPVGRFISGNLYTPNDKDYQGNPLVIRSGPNQGQPRVEYTVGIAIEKKGEPHWAETDWGKIIWTVGHAAFPQGQAQRDDFSWKITDGDSTKMNKNNRRPCDQEAYPGHWILWFSGAFAPKAVNADGSQPLSEQNAIRPGYYIQVFGNVNGNSNNNNPGVYLNHQIVALAGYGKEIISGPDASKVGFGQNVQAPVGMSTTPVGGMQMPATGSASAPAVPAPVAPPVATPPIQPDPAFMRAPAPPSAPVAPQQPTHQMTPKAGNYTYEQLAGAGWTDEALIREGYMLP